MKRRKLYKAFSVLGFFFMTILTVTISVLSYELIRNKSNGDSGVIAISMIFIILFISVFFTVSWLLYNKISVDNDVLEIKEAMDRIAHGDFNIYLTSGKHLSDFDEIKEDITVMAGELRKNSMAGADFISNVSHEIKTPLAVISNSVGLLAKGNLSDGEYQEYFSMLQDAVKRLSGLVSDILALNKMENSKLKPVLENVNLEEILTDVLLNYEDALDKKNLELDCDFAVTHVKSSPLHLKMIFSNLISNAVKFTDKGKITVKTSNADEGIQISVSDTGCGISKNTGSHIFEKFYQGDTSHKTEGNGLGMPMVKSAVSAIGGRIEIESEEGVGTTVSVFIPCEANE